MKRNMSIQLTTENYQSILLTVLRLKDWTRLKRLSTRAAEVGITDCTKLSDTQWEVMLHKLRSVNPDLTKEEREESNEWCIKRGVFPGGHFDEHDRDFGNKK
tara:strand:- start:285 stop:590 length:306 start_codon:yes stop_codon:yes gene_type:complete